MRIDVTYAGGASRIIQTGGETMLSASVMANAPEWREDALPVAAVMLRPRTDLLADGAHGLTVEICAWSAADQGSIATLADFGSEVEVPRLAYHVFRVWEVLPPEELAHVVEIEIDGRIHVRRVVGRLLDVTAYERIEATVLSSVERGEHDLGERVLLVHEHLRSANPGLSDAQVGDMYGLDTALFDYATSMGETHVKETLVDDGLGDVVSSIEGAGSYEARIDAVMNAMLDHPDLTAEALGRAVALRSAEACDVDELWVEAEGRLTDEMGWGDDDLAWDEG